MRKGVYRKGTGTPRKQQAVRPQAAQGRGKGRAEVILTVVYHRQAEYAKLTAERETLNRQYLALKGEVKEAEQIRRSVYNILRQEQREQQPRRAQDMAR